MLPCHRGGTYMLHCHRGGTYMLHCHRGGTYMLHCHGDCSESPNWFLLVMLHLMIKTFEKINLTFIRV